MITKKFFKVLSIWMIMTWMIVPVILADESKEEKNKDQAIERQTFFLLPFGRDFTSLFSILPGVASEPLLGGLSIHGASGAENRFFVDGAETTNLINGTSAQQVNLDFAESIQYKTFGFEAKDDAAMGGTIQVITRSGGNQFHGGITGYITSDWLSGTPEKYLSLDVTDSSKAAYYTHEEWIGIEDWHRIELGLNLSGSIIKDKLWFYGSFMPNFYKLDRTCDFAIQEFEEDPLHYNREETRMNYMLKLTANPIKNIRIGISMVNNFFEYQGEPLQNNESPYQERRWEEPSCKEKYEKDLKMGFHYPNFSVSGHTDISIGDVLNIHLKGGYHHTNQTNQLVTVTEPRQYCGPEQPYGYVFVTNEKWAAEYEAMGEPDRVHLGGWSNYGYYDGYEIKKAIRDRTYVSGDLSYYLEAFGSHKLQAGSQYTHRREDVDNRPTYPYLYLAWDMDFEAYGVHYGRGEYGWVGVRGNSKSPFGYIFNVSMDQWAIYLQDSWTIGDRLTLNLGARAESEYIPGYSDQPELEGIRPIEFSLTDKLSPRLGFIFDVLGNGNLKLFGHFGIYYDHMKLHMAAMAFGGFKWQSAYYPLETLRYWELDGEFDGIDPYVIINHRNQAYDSVDPDLKPMTQREVSLGFQKILSDNLVLSGYIINKSLLRTIEDVGVFVPGRGEYYFYTNPGSDFIKSQYQEARDGDTLEPDTPDLPNAKREYWGVTLNLEKRFSDNWMGGVSMSWSSLRGNYTGLFNSDQKIITLTNYYASSKPYSTDINAPNQTRAFDLWHLSYTKDQQPIDGPLPADRPIMAKAYGSYVFPFGLNLGMVLNAMSGTPITEEWKVDSPAYFPYGRGNMGRTPFLFLADLLISQDIRLGKVTLNLNATIQNLLNAKTVTGMYNQKTRYGIFPTDRQKIDNSWTFESMGGIEDPRFGMENSFVPPIQVRLGAKILF